MLDSKQKSLPLWSLHSSEMTNTKYVLWQMRMNAIEKASFEKCHELHPLPKGSSIFLLSCVKFYSR